MRSDAGVKLIEEESSSPISNSTTSAPSYLLSCIRNRSPRESVMTICGNDCGGRSRGLGSFEIVMVLMGGGAVAIMVWCWCGGAGDDARCSGIGDVNIYRRWICCSCGCGAIVLTVWICASDDARVWWYWRCRSSGFGGYKSVMVAVWWCGWRMQGYGSIGGVVAITVKIVV